MCIVLVLVAVRFGSWTMMAELCFSVDDFIVLFERSEFLIDTSQKKSLRVCPCARVSVCNNLGFSVWYYVPHTKRLSWF